MNDDNQPVKPPPRHSEVMSCLLSCLTVFGAIVLWLIGILFLGALLFVGTCYLLIRIKS